eukprot:TRINITY_DN24813_c0_g1_i1.p1 TRINITY_DN24813_c0_g1~~TRINITY_DN24813_c0_g1_i1.p1  ORF type:complete len:302 (+),score=28.71 TRINITY_DN24813_c0_g1_i1:53-907(+)
MLPLQLLVAFTSLSLGLSAPCSASESFCAFRAGDLWLGFEAHDGGPDLVIWNGSNATQSDANEITREVTYTNSNLTPYQGNGITCDPLTGDYYMIMRYSENTTDTLLSTVDPATGSAVAIGSMGLMFSAITACSDGSLYALSGQSSSIPDSSQNRLFKVDRQSGVVTMLTSQRLPGDSPATVSCNMDDDLLYYIGEQLDRFYDHSFVSVIDPETGSILRNATLVTEDGAYGAAYVGQGEFYFAGYDSYRKSMYALDTANFAIRLVPGYGETIDYFRGIAPWGGF